MDTFKMSELPEGFHIGTMEDYPLILLTLAQAFADYEYPIPSIKISYIAFLHYNYDYYTYVVKNAFEYGTVLTNEDFSAVLVVVPLEKACQTPLYTLAENMKKDAPIEAVENMCAIMEHMNELEKKISLRKETIYIEGIAVQTPHQGKKLCSLLMRELFCQCDRLGYDIALYTNTIKNRDIYEHLGFKCVLEDHNEELNSDTYFMIHYSN